MKRTFEAVIQKLRDEEEFWSRLAELENEAKRS
jgi:hypothetical protein